VIARIDGRDEVLFRIGEKLEVCGGGVEAEKPHGGGALLARGGIRERQPFHREAPLGHAQVRQPDEPEGKQRRGVTLGRAGDGSPSVLSVAGKSAWESRRKAEFEVGFGAEFGQVPFRKLAVQEQTESLAKN
jgi:hypothetical protein